MAIYHLCATIISRGQGRCAVAAAAYRSGEKLYDERQERTFDYRKKHAIAYKEILIPEGAPGWMKDRETLWNKVETSEKRKDSQLAREITLSLPMELDLKQNIALAREFVQNEFVQLGMAADLCVHEGTTRDGEPQPHAHVMLTMREITPSGFGQKVVAWNDNALLRHWREAWAEQVNRYLRLNGIDQRIDHRTLAAQDIPLTPQFKIGTAAAYDRMARLAEHQRIALENGEMIHEDPNIALDAIMKQQSTFTENDLKRFIRRHTNGDSQFQAVYSKVLSSSQVVCLGETPKDGNRYTTRTMLQLEAKMLKDTYALERPHHRVKPRSEAEEKELASILSPQQKEALDHLLLMGDIKCLLGYAGTGKSFLLKQAKTQWEKSGYRVLGATLSGIASQNLEGASGIESRTVASHLYQWENKGEHLDARDILVLDEAGMICSWQMAKIVNEIKETGAKLVLIGDPEQLQAIEAGAAFQSIAQQTGYLELTQIRRQTESWQQKATTDLASNQTISAIEAYEKHDHLHEFQTMHDAKQQLVQLWNDARISHPDETHIILAYTRKTVLELNRLARDLLKQDQKLGEDHTLSTQRGIRNFAVGDRIYFLRNNRTLGVMNGTLGTIQAIQGSSLTVLLDQKEQKKQSSLTTTITFDLKEYNEIDYGYAATIHKAQGVTVDRSYVLASHHFDRHLTYVALTRHRKSMDLFVAQENFQDRTEFLETLSQQQKKDTSIDHIRNTWEESIKDQCQLGIAIELDSPLSIQSIRKVTEATLRPEIKQLEALLDEQYEQPHYKAIFRYQAIKKLLGKATTPSKRDYYQKELDKLSSSVVSNPSLFQSVLKANASAAKEMKKRVMKKEERWMEREH